MGGLEKVSKRPQALAAEVSELPPMQLGQGGVEVGEKRQTFGRDARPHDAAVLAHADAGHEPLRGHPVKQPGQVGSVGEQPPADLAARETRTLAILPHAAQDAQDVELRRAQAARPEKLRDLVAEGEGEALKAQIDLVLEGVEFGRRVGLDRAQTYPSSQEFVVTIVVLTSSVNRG